jgi:hypothetical protein
MQGFGAAEIVLGPPFRARPDKTQVIKLTSNFTVLHRKGRWSYRYLDIALHLAFRRRIQNTSIRLKRRDNSYICDKRKERRNCLLHIYLCQCIMQSSILVQRIAEFTSQGILWKNFSDSGISGGRWKKSSAFNNFWYSI